MQKAFTFFLAFHFLIGGILPNSNFQELSKIPFLLEHFQHHQQENPAISFLDFLALHYTDTQHHEGEHTENHQKLPLLTTTINCLVFQNHFPLFSFKNEIIGFNNLQKTNFVYLSSFSQTVVQQLIKPPIS